MSRSLRLLSVLVAVVLALAGIQALTLSGSAAPPGGGYWTATDQRPGGDEGAIERRVELDDAGDLQARRVLLEEQFAADSVGAAHQRHRALAQVAQEQVGVARMELGEFQLAGLDRRVDQPLRMADRPWPKKL